MRTVRPLAIVVLLLFVAAAHARRRGGGGGDEDLPILQWLLIGGFAVVVGALLVGFIASLFQRRPSNVDAARQRAVDRAKRR